MRCSKAISESSMTSGWLLVARMHPGKTKPQTDFSSEKVIRVKQQDDIGQCSNSHYRARDSPSAGLSSQVTPWKLFPPAALLDNIATRLSSSLKIGEIEIEIKQYTK